MRAAWYEKVGSAKDVLVVGTVPDPVAVQGEVRVRIHSSGVNPSDWKARAGSRPMVAPRIIPHSDGAGIIDQVGPGVSSDRIGERVWIWNGQWKRSFGTAAEWIALPAEQAVPLPANTTFDEGACLGIPALTAYRSLTTDGPVLGKTVLVTGGAGAVGSYAIQFARLLGAARIIATVSSDEKAAHARNCGADDVVNYRTEKVVERVREITAGAGVDRIVEVDAAANVSTLPGLIARDGLYVVYGSGKPTIPFEFGPMIMKGAAVRFFIVYELAPSVRAEAIKTLTEWLEAGLIRHRIAKCFPIEAIAQAHEAVEQGQLIGNVTVHLSA